MYDFANSPFATTILAVIFSTYFERVVAGGEQGSLFLGVRLPGAAIFAYALSTSMAVVAVLSPVLGAMADLAAAKKRYLAVTCYLGAGLTALLATVGPGDVHSGFVLFVLANIAFNASLNFYNAFLPELAEDQQMGRVSGYGWALGYIGGALVLVLNLVMLEYPHLLGFPEGAFTVQHCFLSVAIWWALFSLPTLLWVRERATAAAAPAQGYWRAGWSRVVVTLKKVRHYRELTKFLIAFLIYNDGIETVIAMAAIFGAATLGLREDELIVFFLVVQATAFVGALAFGWLADRIGNLRTVMLTLAVWSGVVLWAYLLGWSGDPRREFWILGILTGSVMGGSQSCSRALQGLFTPERYSAEFFGFFAVSGKFSSVFGPLIYGYLISTTGSVQRAILSLLGFFVIGMAILATVREGRGRHERDAVEAADLLG
jgi:UMF1 family MFS transporter